MTARSAATALTITRAETPEDLDAARALIRAFVAWAMEHVAKDENPNPSVFANLEAEIAGLPGRFGPPSGCLLLARLDGAPVGCVAFYGQDAKTMEIKRMFVSPDAWGHGIGTQMLKVLLAEAEAAGYVRYRLSTHRALRAAQSLYRSVGFRDVPGSPDFPGIVDGVDICMEMIPVRETKEESRLA